MTRPILNIIESNSASEIVINMWTTTLTYFLIFGIFFISSWLICNSLKFSTKSTNTALCLASGIGLILLILFGISITAVKGLIIALILLYASMSDIKTHTVPNFISVMFLILAFIDFDVSNIYSMVMGALLVFIPQFSFAVIYPKRCFGGADLKISTALAFILGTDKGVFALILGMLLAVTITPLYRKICIKDQTEAFPMIPFLSIGALLAYII